MTAGATTFEASTADVLPAGFLAGIVGFFFCFRVLIVLLGVRVFGADARVVTALGLGLNYTLLGVVAFHGSGRTPRTLGSILRSPCYFWILFFIAFSGCSLAWSAAYSLTAAMGFWCAMVADLLMVILMLRTGPIGDMSSGLMKGFVYGACCVAVVAWIMPGQKDLRLGDDELLGPNQIGYACAFAIFFARYLMRTNQRRWKVAAGFLAITVLRSLSKTTIIALMASEIFLWFGDRSISRKTKLLLLAGAALIVALFWGLLSSYLDSYGGGSQAESLTGRVGIWTYILGQAVEQPWIGHGFHSVWKVIPPFGIDQFEARHAHNEVLQQFYAYGVVGVVTLVGLYGSFFRQVRRLPTGRLKPLLFALLLFVVVRGLTDTEVFDLSLPLWAIAMFSVLISERQDASGFDTQQIHPPPATSSP